MDIEKSRKGFEKWAEDRGLCLHKYDDGTYGDDPVDAQWKAWQASRESLVIELHKEFKDDTGKPFGELLTLIANAILEDCRKAIHAAGVKTK